MFGVIAARVRVLRVLCVSLVVQLLAHLTPCPLIGLIWMCSCYCLDAPCARMVSILALRVGLIVAFFNSWRKRRPTRAKRVSKVRSCLLQHTALLMHASPRLMARDFRPDGRTLVI